MKITVLLQLGIIVFPLLQGCGDNSQPLYFTEQPSIPPLIQLDSSASNVHRKEPRSDENLPSEKPVDPLPLKHAHEKSKAHQPIITRYMDFPGDDHFNGKPLVRQIDMKSSAFVLYPDTLIKIAMKDYKTFERYFPKAIADDFENGISTEHVIYPPKLVFKFEIFENSYASRPYLEKTITLKRTPDGELYEE